MDIKLNVSRGELFRITSNGKLIVSKEGLDMVTEWLGSEEAKPFLEELKRRLS